MSPRQDGRGRWAARLPTLLGVLLGAQLSLEALDVIAPPPMEKLTQVSATVSDRDGVLLRAFPVDAGRWRLRADLDRIDPRFVRRVEALEDARFAWHPGVDPASIARAAGADWRAGRVRSGGSTLAMQLARRLQPRRRTLGAKLIEAVRAIQLECRLGPRGVLAAYLTLAPYGGAIEGVRAASLVWFGHEPDRLTDGEQAMLIALPQAPEARRPDRHPDGAQRGRRRVLDRLVRTGLISAGARDLAETDPAPTRHALPALAPQASAELARASRRRGLGPDTVSTLDAGLQTRLEALAAEAAAAQGPTSSAAILVVETRSRAVRAAVGSVGRNRPGGWSDATRALRSPGSALKPFVYAMAFDAGLANAATRLRDTAAVYGGYRPRNFDRRFEGEVTAGRALQSSLNLPAVSLLAKVGPSAFDQRLRAAGVTLVRSHGGLLGPSLALALGGAGATLRDLATLYAALDDGGIAKPLAWRPAEADARLRDPGVRLVDRASAEQVLAILRRAPPPGPRPADASAVAFKTGTSYGYRDALAVGVAQGYTIAVWTGRPDGGARPGLTGREAAAPLLFDAFDGLDRRGAAADEARVEGAPALASPGIDGDKVPPPRLIFPADGSTLATERFGPSAAGFVLEATGRAVRWFVDGRPAPVDPSTGQTLWRPLAPGFYRVTAVDDRARRAVARVRVVK